MRCGGQKTHVIQTRGVALMTVDVEVCVCGEKVGAWWWWWCRVAQRFLVQVGQKAMTMASPEHASKHPTVADGHSCVAECEMAPE